MRVCKFAVVGLLAVLSLFPAGCATPSFRPTRYYSLEPVIEVSELADSEIILGLRPLRAERIYRQRMVFREAENFLQSYSAAEWAEMPSLAVSRALLDALVETGRLADVGQAADLARPDYVLQGEIRKFEEDRRQKPAAAVVEVWLELRRGDDRSAVWSGVIGISSPLPEPGPGGYAEAMNQAVGRWAAEAAEKIAGAITE